MRVLASLTVSIGVLAVAVPAVAAGPIRPADSLVRAGGDVRAAASLPPGIEVPRGHVPERAGHGHEGRGLFWNGNGWGHYNHPGDAPVSP